ncbi:MAG: rhodanese family protein [Rhodospirillaceae bacterium]
MTLQTIDPVTARRLIDDGALLVDIREPGEYAREHMPGALNAPLSRLDTLPAAARTIIFHSRSGARTSGNALRLAAAAGCEAYILDGGIDAWKKAGLPVDRREPIAIERQVQITAGALVLTGVLLGIWIAPAFLALSGFVGAGLMFAGISGWCGMAKLLGLMPWNRRGPARVAA